MNADPRPDRILARAGGCLQGRASVPGDKSISHRAVMLGAIADGTSRIRNWLAAGDTNATLGAMQSLGARIDWRNGGEMTIQGGNLSPAGAPLDLKNAGTGLRLLTGIMAAQPFSSVLDGSAQLRRRPMRRITDPLRLMGADIRSLDGRCPLEIRPARLRGITYDMPVASAQVKSAVLLSGLFAQGPTTVIQPGPARDHTERMLRALGVDIVADAAAPNRITLYPTDKLKPLDLTVPGDFSSAAFPMVAAATVPGSDLIIKGVNLNPTRTGLLDALRDMGADISVANPGSQAGEPVGDIHVRASDLNGIEIGGETVVRMIDEFPALMVAAAAAQGETIVRDARELRVKETDRIAVMAAELRKLGAVIDEREDGFRMAGPQRLRGAQVQGHDDHRIAMSLTIAGLLAPGETVVSDAGCIADSFPGFAETLSNCGADLAVAD